MSAQQPLKPETIQDLTDTVKANHGLFGALHLKGIAEKCNCEICAAIRQQLTFQK